MRLPFTRVSGRSISHGWRVLAASFLILFLNAGSRLIIGVMVKPMVSEFGWSRSVVSAAVFLNIGVYAVSAIISGRLYDRFGPKWVVIVSTVLFSSGYLLMATMTNLWQFLLYYGVLAAAGLGGITTPLFGALLSKWFEKRRGMAISLGMAGTSLGQFALVPLFTAFLLAQGWRTTVMLIGVISLGVNIPLTLLVIRGDPDELGLKPYGRVVAERVPSGEGEAAAPVDPRGLTLREAMHTRSLWLFAVAMMVCGGGDFLMTTHLVPLVTDYGISTTTGANMLAWFGLLSLGGILLAGPVSDRVGNKAPMAAAFAIRLLVFLMVLRFQTLVSFWVLALGFGFTFLVTAPLTPTLSGKMFGFSNIGIISGFITTAHHAAGGLWAYLGGAIFDGTGDYTIAFVLSAALSAVALVCTLLIVERRHLPPEACA